MRKLCRTLSVVLCAALLARGTLTFADADARSVSYDLNIPSEDLTAALQAFAIASHHKLLYKAEFTAGKISRALKGHFTAQEAMEALLSGSGLSYEITGSSVVLIKEQPSVKTSELREERIAPSSPHAAAQSSGGQVVLLAQADQGKRSNAPSIGEQVSTQGNSKSPSADLGEIVVTAEKREERLQDVPVPVTSISADALATNNQFRLQDYYTTIPALILSPLPGVGNSQAVSIRGINSGGGANTVGINIDGVPQSPSISPWDIDPSDVARVEVLRGPQGTLYGSSSMGGLINFLTAEPSASGFSGHIDAGGSGVSNGSELGYSFRGGVNVPISDTLAVRTSGYTHQDPGYIDNPIYGLEGVNKKDSEGGHLSALWKPSEKFSLKLSALFQENKLYGSNDIDDSNAPGYVGPRLAGLQQNYLPITGADKRKIQAYSAILTAKLGSVDLTSVTGYSTGDWSDSIDYSYALGGVASSLFPGQGATAVPLYMTQGDNLFTQEVRLSNAIGERFEWLVGAFYSRDGSRNVEYSYAVNPTTLATVGPVDSLLYGPISGTTSEYAVFADLTIHITERFDIQIGGRQSRYDIVSDQTTASGALVGGEYTVPGTDVRSSPVTYLLTPRLKISPDLMVYARLASGFRVGGPNGTNPDHSTPSQFGSDKTENYELGVKGDFLDHALTLDASLYYIDFTGIQLGLVDSTNGFTYTANGGKAKSDGVELSVEAKPLKGLNVSAWLAWDDAVLTSNFPAASTSYGVSGDPLPYSARVTGNLSIRQDFPLTKNVSAFVGGSVSYVDHRLGPFSASPQRQFFPAYAKSDLQAGIIYNSWRANFFVNNVADKRGVLGGGLGQFPPFAFNYIQPRTVGLNVSKTF